MTPGTERSFHHRAAWIPAALSAAAVAGCSTHTEVSLTGSAPAEYTHVYLTTQEVWFNANSTAGPDESGWTRFTLSAPVTVDLVGESNGALAQLVGSLKLVPATYGQMRLVPVDPAAALSIAAQHLGAAWNDEVDYVDTAGTAHSVPLEIPNAAQGLAARASLKVPVPRIGVPASVGMTTGNGLATNSTSLAAGSTVYGGSFHDTTTTGTTTTGTTNGTTTGTATGTTAVATNSTLGMTGTAATQRPAGVTLVSFAGSLDVATDVMLLSRGNETAALLSARPHAVDLTTAGGIQGTLDLSNLTGLTASSGRLQIYASAEKLSADGTRHEIVASSPVQPGGSFLLYPLPASSLATTDYDLVIHGPGIATIVLRTIPVTVAGTDTSKAIAVGTLRARTTGSYGVELAGSPQLPGGAQVDFLQTLPGSGEVPYTIDAAAIDPTAQRLGRSMTLGSGTVDSGIYVSSGTITLTAAAPREGTGAYLASATGPGYGFGSTVRIVPPAAIGGTLLIQQVAVPAPSLASGVSAGTLAVTVAANPAYDRGELLLTHDGALVASAPLDGALARGGTVDLSGVPAGTGAARDADALYYLAVRTWKSATPGTVHTQGYPTAVDLRAATTATASISIG